MSDLMGKYKLARALVLSGSDVDAACKAAGISKRDYNQLLRAEEATKSETGGTPSEIARALVDGLIEKMRGEIEALPENPEKATLRSVAGMITNIRSLPAEYSLQANELIESILRWAYKVMPNIDAGDTAFGKILTSIQAAGIDIIREDQLPPGWTPAYDLLQEIKAPLIRSRVRVEMSDRALRLLASVEND